MCKLRAINRPAASAFDVKRRLSPSLVVLLGRGFMHSSVRVAPAKPATSKPKTRSEDLRVVYPTRVLSMRRALKMTHVQREQVKLLNRLKRIKGQVAAIESAVEEEKECARILQQATACRGALEGFIAEVIEDHIREHLVDPALPKDDPRAQAAEELVEIVHSYLT